MSEQATTTSKISARAYSRSLGGAEDAPPANDPERAIIVEEDTSGDSDTLRRRRRRRRRRSLKTDNPERRMRFILFGLVIFLLIIALTGAQVGSWLKAVFIQVKPMVASGSPINALVKRIFRWEVLALLIAGGILLYLQPGVEEQVLRVFGIKKERKRR